MPRPSRGCGLFILSIVRTELLKLFLLSICLLFVVAIGFTACGRELSVSNQPQQGKSHAGPVTDYASLIDSLRVAGVSVEPGGEVDQPFFSVKGMMIRVHGEDAQVFQYSNATPADAQAALVSVDGGAVGITKLRWVGPPHFYKKGKLLVLYVGDNNKVLKALEAVLGRQFAGR
ncbi:MAG: hypothetical protein ACREBU_19985 [Nitrososphaera sp.]